MLVHQFTISLVAAAGWSPSAGAPIYRLIGHSGWVQSQCSTLIANCQQHSVVNYARERGQPQTLKVDVRSDNMGCNLEGDISVKSHFGGQVHDGNQHSVGPESK